jgi:hypothetical protein
MGVGKEVDGRAQPLHIDHEVHGIRCIRRPLPVRHHVHSHGRVGVRNSVEAIIDILHLPDPPQPIQRRVVKVEEGIARRRVGITAGIDSRNIVTRRVNLMKWLVSSSLTPEW